MDLHFLSPPAALFQRNPCRGISIDYFVIECKFFSDHLRGETLHSVTPSLHNVDDL